jgi:hypothetical protein
VGFPAADFFAAGLFLMERQAPKPGRFFESTFGDLTVLRTLAHCKVISADRRRSQQKIIERILAN